MIMPVVLSIMLSNIAIIRIYWIEWTFGEENPWIIWRITGGLPNFIIRILTLSHDIYKESKQVYRNFSKVLLAKSFWWEIIPLLKVCAIWYFVLFLWLKTVMDRTDVEFFDILITSMKNFSSLINYSWLDLPAFPLNIMWVWLSKYVLDFIS